MNRSESDIRRFEFGYLIGDLTVGDSAYVLGSDFCKKDEKLYLVKNYSIDEVSEYRANLKVTVIPGNKVLITLHPPKGEATFSASDFGNTYAVAPGGDLCSMVQTWFEEKLGSFEVESIEDFTDMLS